MSETTALAEFVSGTTINDIPPAAISEAKRAIRDYVGVALYGSQHELGKTITNYITQTHGGSSVTLLGNGTAGPAGATLANGSFGHAIDYDDTFESIVIHPTSPIFPAALAATEISNKTGTELLTGYLLGTDVAYRVGHATYPSHYDHGWHNTGTVASFGATAAASSILGLHTDEIRNAFGIVASGSSSLKKNFGSMTKPLHAGHAAQIGFRSAVLANEGFTADQEILEGPLGYGNVMTPDGSYDPTEITTGLGESWGIMDNGFKPYPSGVITHAAMEALRELLIKESLDESMIDTVTVTLDDAASRMLHHKHPENALQAKFSIEFCLAAILREIDVGITEFTDEYVQAPRTQAVIEKVDRAFEPNLFGEEYAGYGARVVITTTDGEDYVTEEERAPGSQTNPLPEERWRAKFIECATSVLSVDAAENLEHAINALDEPGQLEQFIAICRRDHAA